VLLVLLVPADELLAVSDRLTLVDAD